MIVVTQVLNKILNKKNFDIVRKNALDVSYFTGYANEFNFIFEHYKKFGNVPDTLTFLENFPDFEIIEVNETDDYLLDKLYEEQGYHNFIPVLQELQKQLKVDSRLAYNYLITHLNDIKPRIKCTGVDIIKQARERYNIYLNREKNLDTITISTGFPELDEILGGWEYGEELVTIIARINQGKSWMLLKFLTEAWKQGKRVGLYSGEMSTTKLGYRFDALYGNLSNKQLVRGMNVQGYTQYIDKLSEVPVPFIIATQKDFNGRPTVSQLRNFIEENKIEILGIDQLSLMDDVRATKFDNPRLRMAHISEDLFLLSSEYKIPILCLAQANRAATTKSKEEAPDLTNIKESDDVGANSSKVLGLIQTEFGLNMDIVKNREGKVGNRLSYNWDIDTGQFELVSIVDIYNNKKSDESIETPKQRHKKSEVFNPSKIPETQQCCF